MYGFVSRPYRTIWANAILLVGLCGLCMQILLINAKVSNYQQSIFIDKYFFTLVTILICAIFVTLFIILFIAFWGRRKWPLTREKALKMIEHQDFAIFIIKKA